MATSTPSPMSSTIRTLFILCSAYSGQHSNGSPAATPSSVEFHPQCVTNAPAARWRSTASCGAHCRSTSPLPSVLSRNPTGRTASRSPPPSRGSPAPGGAVLLLRMTQRNLSPEFSNPAAISASWVLVNAPMLPKQRNTTERSGCTLVFLLAAAGAGEDEGADAVDRRRGAVRRQAEAVAERAHGVGLERVEGVDEDASGVGHPVCDGEHGVEALGEVGDLERRRGVEREDGGGGGGEGGGARGGEGEEDGEPRGAGGEEEVGRDGELRRDVERVGAEHVEHQRLCRRQRAEEVAERRVGGAEEAEHTAEGGTGGLVVSKRLVILAWMRPGASEDK
nr:unnamed protein product [Digitaria exilis]